MNTTARTPGGKRPRAHRRPIPAVLSILALIGGCVPVVGSGSNGTTTPPGNGNTGDGQASFAVSIQVSNPTPQLFEEVTLRCQTVGTVSEPLTFDFQSRDIALQVDSANGTASFVVNESDLGLTIDVTCSASDGTGRTAQSSRATVAPTG